jgi:hypothetical protein
VVKASRLVGAFLVSALVASGCESILGIKDRKVGEGTVPGLDASGKTFKRHFSFSEGQPHQKVR